MQSDIVVHTWWGDSLVQVMGSSVVRFDPKTVLLIAFVYCYCVRAYNNIEKISRFVSS